MGNTMLYGQITWKVHNYTCTTQEFPIFFYTFHQVFVHKKQRTSNRIHKDYDVFMNKLDFVLIRHQRKATKDRVQYTYGID